MSGIGWETVDKATLFLEIVGETGFLRFFATIVYRLKSVEAIKMKFVAPMPEQIATTTIHFLKVSG